MSEFPLHQLTLSKMNDLVYSVMQGPGEHVGNLKLINGIWKFKAIGYDPQGEVIPGGGPLTHRHNMTFSTPDVAEINAALS